MALVVHMSSSLLATGRLDTSAGQLGRKVALSCTHLSFVALPSVKILCASIVPLAGRIPQPAKVGKGPWHYLWIPAVPHGRLDASTGQRGKGIGITCNLAVSSRG